MKSESERLRSDLVLAIEIMADLRKDNNALEAKLNHATEIIENLIVGVDPWATLTPDDVTEDLYNALKDAHNFINKRSE